MSSVSLLRTNHNLLESRYLAYQMNTMIFKRYVLNNLVGGAMTRFTLEIISRFQIIAPSLAEQQVIANFLDQTIAKIDRQKAQVIEAIERLKEYRSALITDAVTGKMDVHSYETKESFLPEQKRI